MMSILAIVLPIFALIFAGWVVRRLGIMGPNSTSELNRFVVYLALPALLFNIVAGSSWQQLWQPNFVAVFTLSTAFVFILTIIVHARIVNFNADSPVLGLATAYPNTAYLGFPLLLSALGPSSNTLTLIATILVACVLFGSAIILIEARLHAGGNYVQVVRKVVISLAKNPMIAAPVLGSIFPIMGWEVPIPAKTFLKMLGSAASPCALVALGLFLAQDRSKGNASANGMTIGIVALKLAVHPAIAWVLATTVFPLEAPARHAVVLLAMLPTGTGPFMLADFYGREANVTARVILISTILSIASISVYLAAIR